MFGLSALTFLVPAMLAGLSLLAWPVIAHLMHRRPRVYLVFPTIRLLKEAAATTSRIARLRRWLLLLFRCLLVALVVTAFAQPLWQTARATPHGQAAAVVLLIDTSASAWQESGGVRFLHALQAAAERTLEGLQPGVDVANVIEACGRPRAVLPRLTPNLSALVREVQELQPTYERADLPAALALAAEQLGRHGGSRRLVILSDLQKSNWTTAADAARVQLPTGTQIHIFDPPGDPPDNLALSTPRAFPPQPLVGQPVQLVVRVTNFSPRERQARLSGTLDGRDLPPQTVVLKPGEDRDAVFAAVLETPGEHTIEFFSTADGFAPDDRAPLIVAATDRLPVLIVSDDLPSDDGSGTYFLARALAPTGTEADRFDVRQVLGRELAEADLAAAGLVFIGYLGGLEDAGAKRLVEFVRNGGAAVFFSGEGAVARHLEQLEAAARPDAFAPWSVGPLRKLDQADDFVVISGGKWQTRLLREFDESSQLALGQVLFRRPFQIRELHPEAEVLLSFSDSTPAMAVRAYGAGQFVMANFSPSRSSSDLGKHGVFVALMQVLAQELRPAGESLASPRVGEPFHFPPRALAAGVSRLEVVAPDRKATAVPIPVPGQAAQSLIERPALPGIYRLEADGKLMASAGLQLDPRESDLRRTSREDALARLQVDGASTRLTPADEGALLPDLHGRPLWHWCLWLALAAAAAELLTLALWSALRSRAASPD